MSQGEKLKSSEIPAGPLYHYTTPSGTLGILKTREVWASMIHFMNDSGEFKYALDLARRIIKGVGGVDDTAKHVVSGPFLDVVKTIAVFVFSLTEEKDLLSQWRAYSSGGGYALGFSADLLGAIVAEESAILVPCIYEEEAQMALLRPIVNEMLAAAQMAGSSAHGMDIYTEFADRFTAAAARIKHPSFEAEREWRLIFGPGVHGGKTDGRVAGNVIVPYFRCSLKRGNIYPVSTIIVGPSVSADLAGRSLKYITATQLGWPIKVENSKSTLRQAL
jgi:hypothetical protein